MSPKTDLGRKYLRLSPSTRLRIYRALRPILGAVAAYRLAFAWRA